MVITLYMGMVKLDVVKSQMVQVFNGFVVLKPKNSNQSQKNSEFQSDSFFILRIHHFLTYEGN